MPEHRPRTRLAALVAASLVSLFVVVVASTPAHTSATRAGTTAGSQGGQQAGPSVDAASPATDVASLDLAGTPAHATAPVVLRLLAVLHATAHDVAQAPAHRATGRAPPVV